MCNLSQAPGGTVTAGNASPVTDGAAALVLASAEAASRLHLPVLGVLRGQVRGGHVAALCRRAGTQDAVALQSTLQQGLAERGHKERV